MGVVKETARNIHHKSGARHRGRQPRPLSNAIIVGTNARSFSLAQKILENPRLNVNLLGFVDEKTRASDKPSFELFDLNILGELEGLKKILEQNVVDQVFITLPIRSYYSQIHQIIELCETIGIEANILPDLFPLDKAKLSVNKLDGISHISYRSFPANKWKGTLKRAIDIAFSATSLMFVAPIFLCILLLIRITSKGPVFFKQTRVGYHNRVFTMFKFRSMVEDAEGLRNDLVPLNEMDGPVFKVREDPRITPIGRILRKLSLDELPQLINTLKGDMSIVGPRPAIPEEVGQYDAWQRRRQSMKPGITCFWQVLGRNEISFSEWMKLDLKYVDNWSFKLDLRLMLKTIPAIWRGHGAA